MKERSEAISHVSTREFRWTDGGSVFAMLLHNYR
jgi:hypothetical protein